MIVSSFPDLVLSALALLLAAMMMRREALPLVIAMLTWASIFALRALLPFNGPAVPLGVIAILAVGLIATALPAFLAVGTSRSSEAKFPGRPVAQRLTMASLGLVAAMFVGLASFRANVAAVAGSSFEVLDAVEVRAAMNGEARGGGFLVLLMSLAPLVAILGLLTTKMGRRWGLVLILAAVYVVISTPARLPALSLVVVSVAFYLYVRPRDFSGLKRERVESRRRGVGRAIMLASLGVVVGLIYFVAQGESLGKNSYIESSYSELPLPAWVMSPLLYFTGGVSGLSAAVSGAIDPYHGNHPASLFALMRAAEILFPSVEAPDTIARYVSIPVPFNLYTGYGQIYFDFGFAGVALLSMLSSTLAVVAHRRAVAGDARWAWVSAVVVSILISMPLGFRLFNLDVVFQLIVGWIAISWILSPALRTASRGGRRRVVGSRPLR